MHTDIHLRAVEHRPDLPAQPPHRPLLLRDGVLRGLRLRLDVPDGDVRRRGRGRVRDGEVGGIEHADRGRRGRAAEGHSRRKGGARGVPAPLSMISDGWKKGNRRLRWRSPLDIGAS